MKDPDYEPGPLKGGTPHEDDETGYVYVKIDREAVELMADPTYIVPILDHDPISVVIFACRAALAENQ